MDTHEPEINAEIVTLNEAQVAHIIREWVIANTPENKLKTVNLSLEFAMTTEDQIECDLVFVSRYVSKETEPDVQSTD